MDADCIVAIGDGSAMDTAKAIAIIITNPEYRDAAVEAVRKLAEDVGIVCSLKGIVKEEDIDALSADAYADACRPGNPKDVTVEDIKNLYKSLM